MNGSPETTISAHYAALLDAGATHHGDGSITVVLPSLGWSEWWVAALGLRHFATRFPRSRISMALPGTQPFCGVVPHD